jgi:hypothetical protein
LNIDPSINDEFTVQVWPMSDEDFSSFLQSYDNVNNLDIELPTEIEVVAGTTFYTVVSEIDYFPDGYAF